MEKFCNEEPANFEGRYNLCYTNIVRNAAIGPSGNFHFCVNEAGPFQDADLVFTALDEFGAYTVANYQDPVVFPGGVTKNFQGIAQGSTIKMTSFGGGLVNGDGDIILPNETPDTQECTRYDDGILKCITHLEEYCGPNTANETVFPSDCEVGKWLVTYTIESVAVLEGSECPPAPEGFCPDGPPGRKLQEDEEASHPCPILNGKMN